MMFRIVPTYILDEINAKLDVEIAKHPDAEKDRDALRAQLVDYVDQHGVVPDFTLGKAGA